MHSFFSFFFLNIWVACTQIKVAGFCGIRFCSHSENSSLNPVLPFDGITRSTPATSPGCRPGGCCCWSRCRSSAGSMTSPPPSDASACSSVGTNACQSDRAELLKLRSVASSEAKIYLSRSRMKSHILIPH